MIDLVEMIG